MRDASADRLAGTIGSIGPLDDSAMTAVSARLDQLTKPPGSLGRLEQLAIQLAGITGTDAPAVRPRTIVVAAADHGVAARGVSAYPQAVTAEMVANFVAGGAAINVLARQVRANVLVVDVGVAHPIRGGSPSGRGGRLINARVRPGTDDLAEGPAMSREEAIAAIEVGLGIAADESAAGTRVIGLGDMGIGNTTAASAIVATMTGRPVRDVTGRGTGVEGDAYERKVETVERALSVNRPDPTDPIGVLAAAGGLEIGALVGLIVGGAAASIPVVLDGFITGSAAMLAAALCPAVVPRLIAAHRSAEPGHRIVLASLDLKPLFDLDLRLGEGSGAALAMPLIDAACAIRDEMATFASAGVSGPTVE